MFFQYLVFFGLSSVALASAVVVIASKNPVASAIFLVIKLFALAGIYAQLGADFLATIQIILYAGAIMVLFMFVIMVLNLVRENNVGAAPVEWFVGLIAGFSFLVFAALLFFGLSSDRVVYEVAANEVGNTEGLASQLFTTYLWPFELASLLILLAIVASVVIAKKEPAINGTVTSGGSVK